MSSSSSLDKIPVKQSKHSSKRSSKLSIAESKHSKNQNDNKPVKQLDLDNKADKLRKNSNLQLQQQSSQNNIDKEIHELVNQSSILLGSIKDQIENQTRSIQQGKSDMKYQDQMIKLKHINDELDEMVQLSGSLQMKFKMKDSQMQVNQNHKTGELLSHKNMTNNYSSIEQQQNNDTKSIQASFTTNNNQTTKIRSGVSSVVGKVPSENPLSNNNNLRLIMKHEGIQTDQKHHQHQLNMNINSSRNQYQSAQKRAQSVNQQVPKLQLPINNNINNDNDKKIDSENQSKMDIQQFVNQPVFNHNSMHKLPPQSRFVNRTPTRPVTQQDQHRLTTTQGGHYQTFNTNNTNMNITNLTYKSHQQQLYKKPQLLMQDFYRQNQTNISQIQQDTMHNNQNNQTTLLTTNPSYKNILNNTYQQQQQQQQQQQSIQQQQLKQQQQQQLFSSLQQQQQYQYQQHRHINYQQQSQQQQFQHNSLPINLYHHYREPNNYSQLTNNNQNLLNNNYNSVSSAASSTGRFSIQSDNNNNNAMYYQQQQQLQFNNQQINNIDHAMAILMN